jgi:hypothetical protein
VKICAQDKSFRDGIQIRTPQRQPNGFDSGIFHNVVKAGRIFAVPVMNQISGPGEFAVKAGHIAGLLLNPFG